MAEDLEETVGQKAARLIQEGILDNPYEKARIFRKFDKARKKIEAQYKRWTNIPDRKWYEHMTI